MGLEESASLFDLCRSGLTRAFILQHSRTGVQRRFVCVVVPRKTGSVALYSQLEHDGPGAHRFYFETEISGTLPDAIETAIDLMGDNWSLLDD